MATAVSWNNGEWLDFISRCDPVRGKNQRLRRTQLKKKRLLWDRKPHLVRRHKSSNCRFWNQIPGFKEEVRSFWVRRTKVWVLKLQAVTPQPEILSHMTRALFGSVSFCWVMPALWLEEDLLFFFFCLSGLNVGKVWRRRKQTNSWLDLDPSRCLMLPKREKRAATPKGQRLRRRRRKRTSVRRGTSLCSAEVWRHEGMKTSWRSLGENKWWRRGWVTF